jgi:hypothetical protein
MDYVDIVDIDGPGWNRSRVLIYREAVEHVTNIYVSHVNILTSEALNGHIRPLHQFLYPGGL